MIRNSDKNQRVHHIDPHLNHSFHSVHIFKVNVTSCIIKLKEKYKFEKKKIENKKIQIQNKIDLIFSKSLAAVEIKELFQWIKMSETHDIEKSIIDPHCVAESPVRITFQDITSASYLIKSGIEYTPCTVNTQINEFAYVDFGCINMK